MNERLKELISTTGLIGALTFITYLNGFIRLQTPYPELGVRPYQSVDYLSSGALPTIIAIVVFGVSSFIYEYISRYEFSVKFKKLFDLFGKNINQPINNKKMKSILINNVTKIIMFIAFSFSLTYSLISHNKIILFISYLFWLLLSFYFLVEYYFKNMSFNDLLIDPKEEYTDINLNNLSNSFEKALNKMQKSIIEVQASPFKNINDLIKLKHMYDEIDNMLNLEDEYLNEKFEFTKEKPTNMLEYRQYLLEKYNAFSSFVLKLNKLGKKYFNDSLSYHREGTQQIFLVRINSGILISLMIAFYLISNTLTFNQILPIKYQNVLIYFKNNEVKNVKSILLTDSYFYCVDSSNDEEKYIFDVTNIDKIVIKN